VSPSDDLDSLIARAQQGDVRAFETLLSRHYPQIRRYARAFVRSPQDADDLAQDAVLKVYRSVGRFRYQSAFASWLFAIVRNVFLDHAKSRAGQERLKEDALQPHHDETPSETPGPDAELAQQQERARLWEAIRQVPVDFRTALVLFDVEGRSYDEIAAIENVSIGTVKSRLSRGRERLRRILGEQADVPGTSAATSSSHVERSGT
jgi:RNA polymerase sigma-70 factor, ECF subfamily